MVIRRASPDTDQAARSLLQKAVRRGDAAIAQATFRYLVVEKKELNWLRSRLAVMVFEEAWPYGVQVSYGRSENELLHHYIAVSRCQKNKDAAGLGSLAYALSVGDRSVVNQYDDNWSIRVIAKAIEQRDKYWNWVRSETVDLDPTQRALVDRACESSRKASWPWDKAFVYAAALLAVKQPVPKMRCAEPVSMNPFPYWVAIDKHTKKGKEMIRTTAKEVGIPGNIALWLSFYFESALCSELVPSPWWEKEKRWRFAKLGLSLSEGQQIWSRLRVGVAERLEEDAELLGRRISQYLEIEPNTESPGKTSRVPQRSLF